MREKHLGNRSGLGDRVLNFNHLNNNSGFRISRNTDWYDNYIVFDSGNDSMDYICSIRERKSTNHDYGNGGRSIYTKSYYLSH